MEKLDDFAYDQRNVQRNVIVLVVSDKKMKEVNFLMGDQDIGMNFESFPYEKDNFFGHCLKIPLNFDVMRLGSYAVKIVQTNVTFFITTEHTKIINDLEQNVQYYDGKRGVIILKYFDKKGG